MSVTEALLLMRLLAETVHAAMTAGRDQLTPEETARIKEAQAQAEQRWANLMPGEVPPITP